MTKLKMTDYKDLQPVRGYMKPVCYNTMQICKELNLDKELYFDRQAKIYGIRDKEGGGKRIS